MTYASPHLCKCHPTFCSMAIASIRAGLSPTESQCLLLCSHLHSKCCLWVPHGSTEAATRSAAASQRQFASGSCLLDRGRRARTGGTCRRSPCSSDTGSAAAPPSRTERQKDGRACFRCRGQPLAASRQVFLGRGSGSWFFFLLPCFLDKKSVKRFLKPSNYTLITCVTSTKVQILPQKAEVLPRCPETRDTDVY